MKLRSAIIASIALGTGLHAADVRVGSNITQNTVWTSDNTYILDTQVYVVNGAELTIEPGTIVKGADLTTAAASLIITRGSKIYALGTPSDPIIFTAEADPLDGSFGPGDTELWGGLIVLGSAPINSFNAGTAGDLSANPPVATIDNIEGLTNSAENDWTEYGGLDPDDNSGIIRYVSIRHGGSVIGGNNEINGLTLGGVGSGTTIEFVEVFANKDDGFEWFGGTVDARYLVAAFGNDDSFDYDLGWRGRGQFWFSIGTTGEVTNEEQDHAGEHDGTKGALVAGSDRGMGTVYNATYIGAGATQNEGVFEISDDAGVRYYNSIFMDFGGHGIDVKTDAFAGLTEVVDGVTRVDFQNNIWFNLGDGTTADLAIVTDGDGNVQATESATAVTFLTTAKNNTVEDPMLGGISRMADGGLDPLPMAASPAFTNLLMDEPADSWYIDVDFQGAFGESNWMAGWTKLAQDGYLAESMAPAVSAPVALSTVTRVAAGDGQFSNVGIEVSGDQPRMFIVRALSEKLQDSGTPAIDTFNPKLSIRDFKTKADIRFETQWLDRQDAIEALSSYVNLATLDADNSATPPRPTRDESAAVALITLNPGTYVIKMEDEDATKLGGFAQLEVYMIDR